MRTLIVMAAVALLVVLAPVARAEKADKGTDKVDKTTKALAENTFTSADKDKDGLLDETELREARRILRAALLKALKGHLPNGSKAEDRVLDLVKGEADKDKDGKVTLAEFTPFVKSIMDKRDQILKEAQQKQADAAKDAKRQADDAREKARIQELQRELNRANTRNRRR